MIEKIKDLSKVSLNAQDVMLMATVKSKIKSGLDLSAMNNKDKEDSTEELLKTEIIAVGKEVTQFKPKQLATRKLHSSFPYDVLDTQKQGLETIEFRVAVVHMNNIEYAIDQDNYNE